MRAVIFDYLGREPASLRAMLREALVIFFVCSAFALAFNAARAEGLTLVQKTEYRIFVPCPDSTGEVDTLPPTFLRDAGTDVLVVDARAPEAFARVKAPRALNVPYDYLDPVPQKTVEDIASLRVSRVVVYGDGEDPDSGEQLARELSGRGIKNVGFIEGGAPALFEARP